MLPACKLDDQSRNGILYFTNVRNLGILTLSKEEFEYKLLMYPVHMIDEYADWRRKFNQYWNHDPEKTKLWDTFEAEVISHFTHYQLPVKTTMERFGLAGKAVLTDLIKVLALLNLIDPVKSL